MTRFDEVARLKELQAAAKPGPWLVYHDPMIHCPTCKTAVDGLYMMALTDTPWLLEVAACFQPGDAAVLKFLRTSSHLKDVDSLIERIQKAAEIMEGKE